MKKLISMLIVGVVAGIIITGCGSSPEGNTEGGTPTTGTKPAAEGTVPDAGTPAPDAGTATPEAGAPGAATDATSGSPAAPEGDKK